MPYIYIYIRCRLLFGPDSGHFGVPTWAGLVLKCKFWCRLSLLRSPGRMIFLGKSPQDPPCGKPASCVPKWAMLHSISGPPRSAVSTIVLEPVLENNVCPKPLFSRVSWCKPTFGKNRGRNSKVQFPENIPRAAHYLFANFWGYGAETLVLVLFFGSTSAMEVISAN